MTMTRSTPVGVGLPPPRPDGTLHDAIAMGDQAAIRSWALYYEYENSVGMNSVLGLCRTVEDIGYVLTGKRFDEAESVWNVVARLARQQGFSARVDEVEASYTHGG
ncbi:hypothetical protein H7J86_32800 [Mycobacterium hackensackense]|uniref:hypothetical protein n=1 Tax=Mycobacterium hackensackense TaxID=228909 RepID=UPI002265A511|nr:hypothetical protein [Mycobacterium hackensackense]MCV7256965.1 hypothetical protein [Mycobacterium hackensackense]